MTNQERAAEIMSEWAEVKRYAPEIAQQLANANPPILMPDMPESSWPNGIPTNRDSMSSLYTSDGKVYACINAGYDSDNEELTPDEAIEWGYDLIAAARQAQQEQDDA